MELGEVESIDVGSHWMSGLRCLWIKRHRRSGTDLDDYLKKCPDFHLLSVSHHAEPIAGGLSGSRRNSTAAPAYRSAFSSHILHELFKYSFLVDKRIPHYKQERVSKYESRVAIYPSLVVSQKYSRSVD